MAPDLVAEFFRIQALLNVNSWPCSKGKKSRLRGPVIKQPLHHICSARRGRIYISTSKRNWFTPTALLVRPCNKACVFRGGICFNVQTRLVHAGRRPQLQR
eukprot:jgi/Botrbrau1/10811/Bobra.0064s0017.1